MRVKVDRTAPLRFRSLVVVLIFTFGFTAVSGRLVYLQLLKHDYYRKQAVSLHYVGIPIPPRRGNIQDRNGNILARTVTVTDLRIDGLLAHQEPEVFNQIAPILGVSAFDLRRKITPENRYLLLRQDLDERTLAQLRTLHLRPLIFADRMSRVYPNGNEASHVLGFTNVVEKQSSVADHFVKFEIGVDGIEMLMDSYLKGVPGERRVVRDASRREIAAYRQSDRSPKNGLNVVLTIDQGIQHIIENEADRLMKEHHPEKLHIIVANPSTGEILALTNRPTFDPNNRATMEPRNLKNAALMDMYEPGSTFKVVTLTAVLNEGAADLESPIFCENGKFFYAGKWLTDHSPYGTLPLKDVLAKSSNIGFAKLGILLGEKKVYQYAHRFGFGKKTHSRLSAFLPEISGVLRPYKKWTPISLTRIPVGYEVAVTNLQMVMAFSSIANGGKLMEPQIVKAVVDENGNPVTQYLPKAVHQVMTPQVSAEIRQALTKVVSDEGTATLAEVKGFTAAGKTGTAQKLVNGNYSHEKYLASFIGFLPAENPQFVVSIVVDSPQGKYYYGGLVAGPAFSNIATRVAHQLDLPRSDTLRAYAQRNPEL